MDFHVRRLICLSLALAFCWHPSESFTEERFGLIAIVDGTLSRASLPSLSYPMPNSQITASGQGVLLASFRLTQNLALFYEGRISHVEGLSDSPLRQTYTNSVVQGYLRYSTGLPSALNVQIGKFGHPSGDCAISGHSQLKKGSVMMSSSHWVRCWLVGLILMAASTPLSAQIQYARGQDVTPAYDGWARNPDGTFSLFFGYLNRNFEEELDIPLGTDNNIDPDADRGQPTHFYPRRQFFVFKVVVPRDWGLERRVVWTLNIRGKTNIAKGWLQPDWEINDEVMMQNLGTVNDPENEPPVITGSGPLTVALPNTVTLTATAQDDGRPRPRRQQDSEANNQPQGLSIRWIHYRGPGPITFNAATRTPGDGKTVTSSTTASFKAPGVYVLRAIVSDSSLEAFHDVTVTVK